jgi:tetratricopeptide (TPR) repeat protein
MSGQITIIEAAATQIRRDWIALQLKADDQCGKRTFNLCCDFDVGGPWAGVNELFAGLLPEIQAQRPDLIERHCMELTSVLPELRRTVEVTNPTLTDLSDGPERTRNYPADRAYRIVHGLIDLLDTWNSAFKPGVPWTIGCDFYDRAGAMGSLFFAHLMRRRGKQLNLRLVLAVEHGKADLVRSSFDPSIQVETLRFHLPPCKAAQPDPCEAERAALELEQQIDADVLQRRINLPKLLQLWRIAGRPEKLLAYKHFGLEVYNTAGLYKDALRYGEGLLELAVEQRPADLPLMWSIFVKLIMSHLGLNDAQAALTLTEQEGLKIAATCPEWRADLFYYMAMFHARFIKPRNLDKGEEYLERGLKEIELANFPEGQYYFNVVFNRNGLAMIRTFQRRFQEAVELCKKGIDMLETHLGAGEHRLHRSVLYYNMAQVYHAIGLEHEALKYYSVAMEMDPNYSEYHNERGNVFLSLGMLEDAKADYLKAIELSPPYFEVFANLGQCHRRLGAMSEAIESYSRALDIEPDQMLALLGRAKSHETLGCSAAAIQDYSAALALDPNQWEAIASRGVLFYEAGELTASLADFDDAIRINPGVADLYQNRATLLTDLGRIKEAEADLETALSLKPPAADIATIHFTLEKLAGQHDNFTQ